MYLPRGWKAIPRSLACDERVLRVGAKAFGLYVALALHADDAGTVRADPSQLRLMGFGNARLLRDELPQLIEAGLIRRFVARSDAKPGTYAPPQSEIRICESPEERAQVIARSPGRSSPVAWASWLWLSSVVVPSLSRQSSVVVTSPFCPRDWLVKAGMADFFEKLTQKFEPEPENEPENDPENLPENPHVQGSRLLPTSGRQPVVPKKEEEEAQSVKTRIQSLLGDFERADHHQTLWNYLWLFLAPEEQQAYETDHSVPERLRGVIARLQELSDGWQPQQSQFASQVRAATKRAKGQQHTVALLESMLAAQERREANEE